MDARFRHLPAALRELLGPMLPVLFPAGGGARGGRPPVSDLVCLDAVVDIAKGTRWRDVRRASHGVSRDTVLKRLRFWAASGAFADIMDLLVLRGVLGGAVDLSRLSVDSRSIRAKRGGAHRAQSDRPRQARRQAPPPGRPPRHAAGLPRHPRQRA